MAAPAPENNSLLDELVEFLLTVRRIILFLIVFLAPYAIRLLGVILGLVIVATLLFFIYGIVWLPKAPEGMKLVAWEPKARLIFSNISKFDIKDHYEKFGSLYEKGAFPRLSGRSKEAAFASVYSRLASTPEREDEMAFLAIMTYADDMITRISSKMSKLGVRITDEDVQGIFRDAAQIHFLLELRRQCDGCSGSTMYALATEQADVIIKSCLE